MLLEAEEPGVDGPTDDDGVSGPVGVLGRDASGGRFVAGETPNGPRSPRMSPNWVCVWACDCDGVLVTHEGVGGVGTILGTTSVP